MAKLLDIGASLAGTVVNGIIGDGRQRRLMDIQKENQKELNRDSFNLNKEMWDYTNYENQVKHMENAGLNVGLMYGSSGGNGGTTGNISGSAQGGTPTPMDIGSSIMQAANIELIKSQTNKNNAEAANLGADTTTKDATRDLLIENLKQSGITNFLDNKLKAWISSDESVRKETDYNDKYDYHVAVGEDSLYAKQVSNALLKTMSETDLNLKNIDLTDKKIQFYWLELLNETKKADAAGIQAAASKLSAEWNTGEFTNWKTWAEQAQKAIQTVGGLVKGGKGATINDPKTTINNY